ncbi:MAG: ATP-binding protein [Candidatus Kariarchaeaceae archaeon]|jgi:hypothetical protein
MRLVDEIAYLSEIGYEFMHQKNYPAAKRYFIDAASKVTELLEVEPIETQDDLKYIANTLIELARSAHLENFELIDSSAVTIANVGQKLQLPKKKKSVSKVLNTSTSSKKRTPFRIPLGISLPSHTIINWTPEELMNGIMTITGGSGSGKTETLKNLVRKIIRHKIPCLVLDLHGDIELDIDVISLDYQSGYGVNPLELTSKSRSDGGPVPHINHLMNQFSYALKERFSPSQNSWLRKLIKFSYLDHGITQKDATSWDNKPPNFKYLLNLIQNPEEKILASKNNEFIRILGIYTASTRLAIENRLTPILEHPAFSGERTIPMDQLITKPVRILLKPLNTIDMQFLAADTIMKQVFAHLVSMGHLSTNNEEDKFRLFIVIDEVKILTGFRGKLNDPYHILNRLAAEARKFGMGLILASQIIGHFGRDIRSNSATKLILRTMDLTETKHCAKELKIPIDDLAQLSKPGEGYIITSKQPDARHIQLFSKID